MPSERTGTASASRSPDLVEVAVAAEAALEAVGTRDTVRDQRFAPVVPLLDQPLADAEPVALDCRAPISTHAHLREACDRPCQLLRFLPGATLGCEVLAQAYAQALLRRHLSPSKDDLEG